jgi:anti-sigma regulatory factor (Ser/Thr protein kinase)
MTIDDVVLAVNEAVTNAVVLAYRPDRPAAEVALTLWREQDMVCIAVQDRR